MSAILTMKTTIPANRQIVVDLPSDFPLGDGTCDVTVRPNENSKLSEKIHRDLTAFHAMLPNLLITNAGEFVAIHNGQVVASGPNEIQVRIAASERYPHTPIPVRFVSATPRPIERIRFRKEIRSVGS